MNGPSLPLDFVKFFFSFVLTAAGSKSDEATDSTQGCAGIISSTV
jgi:hypothetical protein